jgi:hypothetical protein
MNKNTGYGFWGLKGSLSIIAVIACVAIILSRMDIIPKKSITQARMMDIERQLLHFNNVYHRLPANLDELVATNGNPGTMIDGWGHPIQYLPQANGVVLLKSTHGDIEGSFSLTNEDL